MSENQEEAWVYVAVPVKGEDEEPNQHLLTEHEDEEDSPEDTLTPKPEDSSDDVRDDVLWWLLVALAAASFFLPLLGGFFAANLVAKTAFSSEIVEVQEIPSKSIQLIPTFDAQAVEHPHHPVEIPWTDRDYARSFEYIPQVNHERASQHEIPLPVQPPKMTFARNLDTKALSEVSNERQGTVRKRCDTELFQNHDHCVEDETDTQDSSSSSQGTNSVVVTMPAQRGIVESEDAVTVLTEDQFKEFIAQHRLALVVFQAPWCGACRRLAPSLQTFAREAKSQDWPVGVASVDCILHANFCRSELITHFPSLRWYKRGSFGSTTSGIKLHEGEDMDQVDNFIRNFKNHAIKEAEMLKKNKNEALKSN